MKKFKLTHHLSAFGLLLALLLAPAQLMAQELLPDPIDDWQRPKLSLEQLNDVAPYREIMKQFGVPQLVMATFGENTQHYVFAGPDDLPATAPMQVSVTRNLQREADYASAKAAAEAMLAVTRAALPEGAKLDVAAGAEAPLFLVQNPDEAPNDAKLYFVQEPGVLTHIELQAKEGTALSDAALGTLLELYNKLQQSQSVAENDRHVQCATEQALPSDIPYGRYVRSAGRYDGNLVFAACAEGGMIFKLSAREGFIIGPNDNPRTPDDFERFAEFSGWLSRTEKGWQSEAQDCALEFVFDADVVTVQPKNESRCGPFSLFGEYGFAGRAPSSVE